MESKEERVARYRAEAERLRSEAANPLIEEQTRDELLQIAELYEKVAIRVAGRAAEHRLYAPAFDNYVIAIFFWLGPVQVIPVIH
jgi:hypothetical protein